MFLKKINIHGFKSFADKTEIIIEKGMTAIVGPNGSGKSNISDSIKWVLGEQSPKTLRGTKMEDIIFAGTQKRMSLGYAEVELIFDNENGKLPIDYKEVCIKRRLFRTGESEYSINKKSCRLKDVRELFMDTGIGKDGYSVIGQGKVEEILSPNSEVRRGVFEEAAGIVKYKVRKEEAEKKIEKTEDNLDRVKDIINELEIRVEPLKNESEKANKYIGLKDRLKNIELNLYVREYEKNKENLGVFEQQQSDIFKKKEEILLRRDALEGLIKSKNSALVELETKLSMVSNNNIQLNKKFDSKINSINVQKEKINLYSENIGNTQRDIDALNENLLGLEGKISGLKIAIDENNEVCRHKEEEQIKLNEYALEFKIKMEASMNASESKRNNLFEMHKLSNKLQSEINSHISVKETYEDRLKDFEREIETEKMNLQSSKDNLRDTNTENKINDDELKKYQTDLNKENEYLLQLTEDKNQLEKSYQSSLNDLNTANSKIMFLNNMESLYEGYYKSVQSLMSLYKKEGLFKGAILGTVADVIKTDKEFELAIEIALGSAIQNVIVNNTMDAEAIIKYLKDNKIGRVTFLPITSIKPRELDSNEEKYLEMPGVIDTADKLIDTDSRYQNIVKSLLGKTIIVETIRDGFRIAKASNNTIKIVSLEGDVINPGGAVTGGHAGGKSQNLLSRKREIDEIKDRLGHLKKKCDDIQSDIQEVEIESSKTLKKVMVLKQKIDENNAVKIQLESKISILCETMEKTEMTISRYENDKLYIVDEIRKKTDSIDEITNNIATLKGEIELLESEINDLANTSKDDKDKYEEIIASVSSKNIEIQAVKQEIKYIEEKINETMIEMGKNKEMLLHKKNIVSNTDADIEQAKVEVEKLQKECEELKIIIEEGTINQNKIISEQEKTKLALNNSNNEYNSISKKITEDVDDEYNLKIKIERLNSKIEEITNKLWDDYEMNYAMALQYKDENISFSKINSEVLNIRREIKALGDVNVNAIKEYAEVKNRYDFLTKQKQDLIDAKNQLIEVIRELEQKMKEQFVEEFSKIKVVFNDVFVDLFNGGKADVYLEDESDALNSSIEIAAQPPGKKLSKISLLSGGEKALTAIALLFSILKTKPTSFCILDEIEAALDDINVYRFSRYLRDFSKEIQFLCITHRKGTMESADTLYGTTMEEKGVTKLVSVKLSDIDDIILEG